MGALRQPKLTEASLKKPPAVESRKLDQYGRDPASPVEQLRGGAGFSPLFHAMLADMPRLLEGSAAGWSLVTQILRLSLGRPHDADKGRYEKTEPISTAELAELCRVNVKTIQRQLDELAKRGVISCETQKAKAGGFIRYVLSLRLADWRKLEDYAVWQRSQIKAVDDSPEEDGTDTEDADQTPISKDAVHLFKKPAVARPGRSTRAARLTVGAREVVCQNDSPTVDVSFLAVVQSGRLVVSATVANSEVKAKGERKANDTHVVTPPNRGSHNTPPVIHPRADEIANLFDPYLAQSGATLLRMDRASLRAACDAIQDCDSEYLKKFATKRAASPIKNPKHVALICEQALGSWRVARVLDATSLKSESAEAKKLREDRERRKSWPTN